MKIINYYRGSTDRLSGFVYDTDNNTYKEFTLAGNVWTEEIKKGNNIYSVSKKAFKLPADIDYFFPTKSDMSTKLTDIKNLGFTEDAGMILDFGVCTI